MSFASEKLYKGYLRRNMPTIVTTVKVREIVPHLPCLTDHDRENIEAKRETYGNYDSMVLLLDCLKRRENWVDQFIEALEACDHLAIAADIRQEYGAVRGGSNSAPSSPPTTVIRAHVHPAPSPTHLPVPETGGKGQEEAVAAPPAEASAPPEPAARASPPPESPTRPQTPQSSAAQVPEAVSPPEPPQSAQIEVAPAPSTPPPSPEAPRTQATNTPPPQRESHSHQEPVENSESDIQDIAGVNGVSAGNEVSIGSADASPPPGPVEQCETDTPPHPDPRTTTEVGPPSPAQIHSDVTDESSFPLMTSEEPPVQDTTPPVDSGPAAAALEPEETSDPAATQGDENSLEAETAATASPPPGAALLDDAPCLSKPGELISVLPQDQGSPTIPAADLLPAEPYSGDSERLEISGAAETTSAHVPACSAVSPTVEKAPAPPPCQENGVALNHNEPEENHYESPCPSLEVRENVVQISEEPSILNLDGQNTTPQARVINGDAAKEIASAPTLSAIAADLASSVNDTPPCENHHPSEPAGVSPEQKSQQDSEEKAPARALPANTKYILTAAGVGACALLMAWKFKN